MTIRGVKGRDETVHALFLNPDGSHFWQASMGGSPDVVHEPRTHPALTMGRTLHPDVSHLEYRRTRIMGRVFAHEHYAPVYVFCRALRQIGPPVNDEWLEVPLLTTGQLTRVDER